MALACHLFTTTHKQKKQLSGVSVIFLGGCCSQTTPNKKETRPLDLVVLYGLWLMSCAIRVADCGAYQIGKKMSGFCRIWYFIRLAKRCLDSSGFCIWLCVWLYCPTHPLTINSQCSFFCPMSGGGACPQLHVFSYFLGGFCPQSATQPTNHPDSQPTNHPTI